MKIRKSTQIAIGFALLVAIAYGGYILITNRMIMTAKFEPIPPGDVNIVGVDTGAGYQIIVANQMAQLVQAQSEFGGDDSAGGGGATEGAIKKRIPVREMLNALAGDEKALSQFVMVMNDMAEDETWPNVRVIWEAEDIRKALEGDAGLRQKLVKDLNVQLDGTPLPTLRFEALENGIMIQYPVTVQVNQDGRVREMTATVMEPYKPRLLKAVEEQYKEKGAETGRSTQTGYYVTEAERVLQDPSLKEDVAGSLKSRTAPEASSRLAAIPERILSSAKVVVNDSMITGAKYEDYATNKGNMYKITLSLNDEGRRRLWQYSKQRVGDQLLLTVKGIAIAAPRIQHELAQGELTISQLEHKGLVMTAVDMINESKDAVKTR